MFGKSFFGILILAVIALMSQLTNAEPQPFIDRGGWNKGNRGWGGSGSRIPPIPGTPPFNPQDPTYRRPF